MARWSLVGHIPWCIFQSWICDRMEELTAVTSMKDENRVPSRMVSKVGRVLLLTGLRSS